MLFYKLKKDNSYSFVASAMHICMLIGGEHFYIAQYYHTTVKICFILEDID